MPLVERERLVLLLEHHGAVADVVADAEVAARFVRVEALVEERHGVLGAVEEAAGLGLEVDGDAHAACVFEFGELLRDPLELRGREADARAATFVGEVAAPADRHGRDRHGARAGRDERDEDLREVKRVERAVRVGPVRVVDARLHRLVMEIAVRKAVERARREMPLGEPVAESRDAVRLGEQLARGLRGEPEADAEFARGREDVAHARCVLVEH